MEILNLETLTSNGFVIAKTPNFLTKKDDEPEQLKIEAYPSKLESSVPVGIADTAIAVKCYHDRVIIVDRSREETEIKLKDFFPKKGHCVVQIQSANSDTDIWSLVYEKNCTAVIHYVKVHSRLEPIEAVVFVGMSRGLEDVLYLTDKANLESELDMLIPRYADYYNFL